ncbi:hypothetical protein D3C72_1547980 [compost metagenome]
MAELGELRHQALHHGKDRLVQGHVHILPLAVVVAQVMHGQQRADDAVQRCQRVADADAGTHRRPVGVAADITQPAHRFRNRGKAGTVLVGAGLAIAGDAHHDQGRIHLAQVFPAQTPFLECAGTEVLDHDIGFSHQLAHDFLPLRAAQVQRQRLLVAALAVPPQRGALIQLAPFAQWIALTRRFDLQHLGAKLREQAAGIRAGDQRSQLHHAHALQRHLFLVRFVDHDGWLLLWKYG